MILRNIVVERPTVISRRVSRLLLTAAIALPLGAHVRASTQSSTWVGATSTNWSNPANWSPNSAFPNNGNGGFSDYNVTINAVTTPNLSPILDVTATIDHLTLSAGAALSVNPAIGLTLSDSTLNNSGTITLLGDGAFGIASLTFSNPGPITLTGGGTILFTNSTFSRLFSGTGAITNVDNTLQGAGFINANVTNQSLIRADNGTLTLSGNISNSAGNISVTSTGNLVVNATLTGGNLSAATGSVITGSGSMHNVTLTAGSDWKIQAATSSPIIAETFTNNASITLLGDGSSGVAAFAIDNTSGVTLTGNGTINLTDSTFSRITGGNLTNTSNTIQGAGFINTNVINQSLLRAQNGTLTLSGTVNNSAGNISVTSTGNLTVNGTLTGGNLSAASGSQISGSGSMHNVTLTTGSVWKIPSAASSPTISETFTNNGSITLLGDGSSGIANFAIDTTNGATLAGSGTITLTDGTYSRITGGNLTNASNTIQGAGVFSAFITNQSSIIAQNGNLTIAADLNNTAGHISVASTGNLITNAILTGGNISLSSGSILSGSGTISNSTLSGTASVNGTVQFKDVTLAAGTSLTVNSANAPVISGNLTNGGNVTLLGDPSFGVAALNAFFSGTTTLTGNGTITLTDGTYSRITGGNLTNASNTIQGAGVLSAFITNQASIIAQNGNLTIAADLNNAGGTISIAATGNLVTNSTITGGTITSVPGSILSGGGTISAATLTGNASITGSPQLNNDVIGSGGNISVASAASPQISGTLTNHANITLHGDPSFGVAALNAFFSGNNTLTGNGTITLTDPIYSRITGGNLTNVDNTIQGAGTLSAFITNQGTILAQGGNLTIAADLNNSGGTISVAATGNLLVNSALTGGTITLIPGSTLSGSGNISAATINGTGSISGPVQLTNDTVGSGGNISISAGASLPLIGSLTNHGNITLHGDPSLSVAALVAPATGSVSVGGGGTITLTDGTYSRLNGGNLTNTDNTIRGAGTINATLTNQGALIAENGTLTINGNFTGSGSVTVAPTGTLAVQNFTQSLVTNNGQFTISGNGTITSILGTGALTASSSHLVIPQNSPIIKQSDLTVTGSGALDITNNKIVLASNDSAKAVTIPRLHTEINNGSLTSATAIAINNTSGHTDQVVAVVDNAIRMATFGSGSTNFGGTNNVDANSILITATYLGDANLDGVVDIKDLQDLANHWQQPVTDWSQADFDGNGVVALQDLQAIANHWQSGVGAPGQGSGSSFSDALSLIGQFSSSSSVPEPMSLAILSLGGIILASRRRNA